MVFAQPSFPPTSHGTRRTIAPPGPATRPATEFGIHGFPFVANNPKS
jgi:hypothetical protein